MFVDKHDVDDELKLWLALVWSERHNQWLIHAFSDNEDMFKAYLDIHKKNMFKVKTIKGKYWDIMNVVNHNLNAEIDISHLQTRMNNGKVKVIPIPATADEMDTFNNARRYLSFTGYDELYSDLYNTVGYLKDEYKEALNFILLGEMCVYALGKPGGTPLLDLMELDELRFFLKVHAETF